MSGERDWEADFHTLLRASKLVAGGYLAKRISGVDEGEDNPAGDMALSDLVDACEALDPAARSTAVVKPRDDREVSTDVAMEFLSAQADEWINGTSIPHAIEMASHAAGPLKDKLASVIDGLVRQAFVEGAYLGRMSLEDGSHETEAGGPSHR